MEAGAQHAPTAYIDEAGDEGFVFGSPGLGSSDWFVLAALVMPGGHDAEVVHVARRAREALGRGKDDPLHFRKLVHAKRRPWLRAVAQLPAQVAAVAVDKRRLTKVTEFQGGSRLYFKAVDILAAELSSLARQSLSDPAPPRPLRMVFSNRESLPTARLAFHIAGWRQRAPDGVNGLLIDPAAVRSRPARQVAGLQVADAIASALFMSLNPNPYGDMETEYLELLSPLRKPGLHPWPRIWPPGVD